MVPSQWHQLNMRRRIQRSEESREAQSENITKEEENSKAFHEVERRTEKAGVETRERNH